MRSRKDDCRGCCGRAILRVVSQILLAVLAGLTLWQSSAPQTAQAPSPPSLPFYDWKACPFEGCVYRQWTARKPVRVFDTWKARREQIAALSAGDKVRALTGVVITFKPGLIRMDRDLPDKGLVRGDTILTYTYRGEGFSAVWFKGKFESEFDISFTSWPDGFGCGGAHCAATYVELPRKTWWVRVRLATGRTGWVKMDTNDFDGVDVLAGR